MFVTLGQYLVEAVFVVAVGLYALVLLVRDAAEDRRVKVSVRR